MGRDGPRLAHRLFHHRRIGVHLFPADRDWRFLTELFSQLVLVFAPAALGVIGALLILAANPRLGSTDGRLLRGAGVACIALAVLVLTTSTIVKAIRSQRGRP